MAQTTGQMSGHKFKIEVRTTGEGSWTDISGSTNSVTGGNQNRMTGETYTGGGEDTAIITTGPREPMDLQVRILYTEESGEAFETLRALFEADTRVDMRFAPKGGSISGAFVWNVINQPISNLQYPDVDAGSAGPVMSQFTIRANRVVKTTAASSTGLGSA
jgi:hypothetical protein